MAAPSSKMAPSSDMAPSSASDMAPSSTPPISQIVRLKGPAAQWLRSHMDEYLGLATTQGTHSKFAKLKAAEFITHFDLAPKTHEDGTKTDPLEGISFHKPVTVGQITDASLHIVSMSMSFCSLHQQHVKQWYFNHARVMKGSCFKDGRAGGGPQQLGQVDDNVGESDDEVDELGPSQSKEATAPSWTTLATATKHAIGAEHRRIIIMVM
ncbi:hypothetical protein JB92DRAFT_3108835 [Gautieria morchelliformis]|nr:hypothetical protein JB92DRAFT_3108835 [Gautieria morchelliformis]